MKRVVYGFCLLVSAAVGSYGLQRLHDSRFPPGQAVETFQYLPSGAFLKGAALAFDEVLADYLWIQALGYFGTHYQTDREYPWLAQLLDTATALDPYYQAPYEFGGIVFAYALNDVERSNAIFARGMEHVPRQHDRYWYFPFFTAFNYMYYQGDYATAAHYLEQAAQFPQRPAYLPLLVARLYANTDNPAVAIPFLQEMQERAATPEMRAELGTRILEVRVKEHLLMLEKARTQFRQRFQREPPDLQALIAAGILAGIPEEPFGGHYFIGKDGTIQTSSKVDDMKVHAENIKPPFVGAQPALQVRERPAGPAPVQAQ